MASPSGAARLLLPAPSQSLHASPPTAENIEIGGGSPGSLNPGQRWLVGRKVGV